MMPLSCPRPDFLENTMAEIATRSKGKVTIKFWEKSFRVTKPVSTGPLLYLGVAIDRAMQDRILFYFHEIIMKAQERGNIQAKDKIREAIGL